jgi:hypothetical protein
VHRLELLVVAPFERPVNVTAPAVAEPDDDAPDAGFLPAGRELLIVVNGVSELDRWGGMGLPPNALLDPEHPLLPPGDGSPVEVVVQQCGCGEVGCGSLAATIARDGDTVVWSFTEQRDDPRAIGPFTFAADEYEREVRRAHDVRPWETRDEHVARLVAEALSDCDDPGPYSFDWATSHNPGSVLVSMTHREPSPRAGARRGEIGHGPGWIGYTVEQELTTQYLGGFSIAEDLDDEEAAASILRKIERSSPPAWPRPTES